jgi:hypothetical protein
VADMSRAQVSESTAPVVQITAEPSHGGIVLTITRHRTSRIWIGLDEIPRIIAVLQANVSPITVRRIPPPGDGGEG